FETTISAIIEETYQNGNYYIRGEKEMLIEGQKQKIIISGVIRPYDITSDNSINSSQIANLKLLYNKDGTESDILDTPWGLNFMRKIWPF
ncbi:flagellar basal body L-ring protein FlgH, partial [Aliarcobacter butzleri]